MFWETFLSLCNQNSITPNGLAKILGVSSGSITSWKNGRVPHHATLLKIANYFDVSVDYLLSSDNTKKIPDAEASGSINEDLKVALFGGGGEVTDEMWNEVVSFAKFVQEREARKNNNNFSGD